MQHIRAELRKLAHDLPEIRGVVVPLTKSAAKWETLPKGWTDESVSKFWETLTGDNKHKVTKCIKEMSKGDKNIDDPGAFCAALADKVMGPEWRKKKASARRVAARFLQAAAQNREAADILKVISELFVRHQPHVKDWNRFIRDVRETLEEIHWEVGSEVEDFLGYDEGFEVFQGEQIGGGYWDPPEYAEVDVEVATGVDLLVSVSYNMQDLKRWLYRYLKRNIKDVRGFEQATSDMFGSQSAVKMLGKLLSSAAYKAFKESLDSGMADDWLEDIETYVDGSVTSGGFTVNYSYAEDGKAKFQRPTFKVTGKDIKITSKGYLPLAAEVEDYNY